MSEQNAKDTKKFKRVDNETRENQYKAIKKRLNKKFAEMDISLNKLRDKLNETCNFEINYETLRKTLDEKCNTLDIYCVIAMCRFFDIDISYVLAEPDRPLNDIINEENHYVSEKFTELDDRNYHGTYTGFFYTPKKGHDVIDDFELTISKRESGVFSTIEINFHSVNSVGEKVVDKKRLSGKPVLVRPGVVYIRFTDNAGYYYIFSFAYAQYNKTGMYYRRGVILTQGRTSTRQPMVQAFVMFSHGVAPENMEMIKGLLLLNNAKFHVPARELEMLVRENRTVRCLFNNLNYIFEKKREPYYVVDEVQILHSLDGCMTQTEALAALQLIKAHATDANRVFFIENDDYSEFSKSMTRPIREIGVEEEAVELDNLMFVD